LPVPHSDLPDIRIQKSAARNPHSDIRTQQSEIRNPKSELA
jgi:hypothetical protein